jgi:hypothetical protein
MSLIEVKKAFFSSKEIQQTVDKQTINTLSRLGAFIRRTAQFSMRSKKGPSPAGTPPHAHGQKLLRKFLFFNLDKSTKSLIVGPVRLDRTAHLHVPKIEEFGGTITVNTRKGVVTRRYPARPTMRPAGEENLKKLPDLIRSNRKGVR